MILTLSIVVGVLSLTVLVMLHREFTWRVRGRNRNTIAYMVARVGDMGEEYRSSGGAWSLRSGAVYMQKSEAIVATTGLEATYLVPLRLDPRTKVFPLGVPTFKSDVVRTTTVKKTESVRVGRN